MCYVNMWRLLVWERVVWASGIKIKDGTIGSSGLRRRFSREYHHGGIAGRFRLDRSWKCRR